jgi:inosose dehydratase
MTMPSTIRVGNAPCSWGTLEFEASKGERIEYQQMLDELAETGYVGTELGDWGFMPTEPGQLRAELGSRRLAMLGAFVPVALKEPSAHAPGADTAVRTARLLAAVADGQDGPAPFLVLSDDAEADPVRSKHAGRVTREMGLTDSQWRTFAQGAERVARAVREATGLRTVFHHHCAGYVETPEETARLLDLTDPSLLGLVFDTGHFAYGSGGCDPQAVLAGLERFRERIWYVHLKDCQLEVAERARALGWSYMEALRHGVFCELGRGLVPFPDVLSWLRARQYRGFVVVEQDVLPGMGAPKESARRNREYLQSIGL